jgi:hypothetical protein
MSLCPVLAVAQKEIKGVMLMGPLLDEEATRR